MREIKFRAVMLHTRNGEYLNTYEWVYGGGVVVYEGKHTCMLSTDESGYPVVHRVEPDSVGQFTGLYDKHNVPIYESDIVTAKYESYGNKAHKLKGFICWSESHVGWGIEDHKAIYRISAVPMGSVEVIGSVYEHPDLLK